MKNKLTSILITKNEEENIKRCLDSIKAISDEIIVVDSGSTDKTLQIAKSFGAKVFDKEFEDFSVQRNFALSKAENDWILSLDADEEISSGLQGEILQAIDMQECDAYLVPRKNVIFGKEIKHTRWSPDEHIWLFKKSKSKFVNSIHEEVEVDGSVGELTNSKIHYSHKNIFEFLEKTNFYTGFEAINLKNEKIKFNFYKMLYAAKKSFIGRFLIKKGFLDGWRGFVLSYLRAVYKLILWVKVWEQEQK